MIIFLLKSGLFDGKNGVVESEVIMKQILKLTEWQDACTGNWHCNDVSLGFTSAAWWNIPRMLGISPTEYAKMLTEEYNAEVSYRPKNDVLLFHWRKQSDMRRFKNTINRIARERKFFVGE